MTTAITSFAIDMSSTAGMRVACGGISSLLDSIGLTKTADTGQVDWATANRPGTTNTAVGYEIRTVSTTVGTLVLKVSYETGAATTGNNLKLGMQLGTGSDGAGALTGAMGSMRYNTNSSSSAMSSALLFPSYACSWDGGFFLAVTPMHTGGSVYRLFQAFDRTCTSAGAVDGEGIIHVLSAAVTSTATLTAYGYSADLGVQAIFGSFPARLHYPHINISPSLYKGNQRPYAVVKHMTPAPRWHKNLLVGSGPDTPLGLQATMTVLGAERTYLSLGPTWGGANGYPNENTNTDGALLVRWE